MATAVTISIVVDSAQAQAAIGALNKSLTEAGVNGDVAFKRAGQGVKDLEGHAATSLDAVRLLSQEFGLRLPRAIEAMLSRMPAVTNALNAFVGGLAGIAALEVFAHVGEGAYKLYNQYISLNAEADKFYETLKKTAQEDISNTRSIETTRRRISDATQNATAAPQVAQGLQGAGIGTFLSNPGAGLALILSGRDAAKEGTIAQGNMIKLGKVGIDQEHEKALAIIESNHAMDAGIASAKERNNLDAKKKIETDAENKTYNRKVEMFYGNVSPGNAGDAEQNIKDETARKEAAAANQKIDRDSSLAMMKYHDEMVQSKLRGDELYQAKVTAIYNETMLAEINAGKGGTEAKAAALAAQVKMEREHADRQKQQMEEARQELAKAGMTGLSPTARADAEYRSTSSQIKSSVADGRLSSDAGSVKEQAAVQERQNKILEIQEQFTERMKALDDGRVANALQGYGKIAAEEQKRVNAVNQDFNKTFGSSSDAAAIAARKTADDAITQIHAGAIAERSELDAKNANETLRYDEQAAESERRVKEQGLLGFVAAYKNSIQEINEVDADRRKKVEQEFAAQQISQTDAAQRKAAIDREANAQIAEQNMQMQHQIAGDLQQAFTHPVDYIKSAMEKMFFEIVASWVMKMDAFQSLFGNKMGGMQQGGGAASGVGGILSTLTHGAGGAFGGSPQLAGYSSASGTSAGGIGGGGTISSGSTGSFGSAVSGIGSLAQTAANIPGLGGAFGGASSGLTYNDATGQFESAGSPGVTPTLAGIGGFGDATTGGLAGGASMAMGLAGAGMGAFTAGQSTLAAYKSGNVLQGALGDAASGAAIGALGGPLGSAIGAGIGAGVGAAAGLVGMIGGEGAKLAARDYYNQSVFPTLNASVTNSNYGDFQSAINSVDQTAGQALVYMRAKFGGDAANWVNDNYMKKEVEKADQMISNSAEGGRQFTQMSAKQFHTGGTISGFGSFATSENEGFIHAAMGETVMTPGASSSHGPMLSAMNAGASAADIAGAYLKSSGAGMPAQGGSGGDSHIHVHTLDTKTMTSWLRGGGAKMITNAQNNYSAQYAGDGIG